MIAIIDYGVGNLYSLKSSLKALDIDSVTTNDPVIIANADKIILPGVGAFEDAMKKLTQSGLNEVVKNECSKGKYLLGICLGMQLLFDKSYEFGEHEGLGLIPGDVVPIADYVSSDYKIPQIGWNSLTFNGKTSPLFQYIHENDYVYFVHSYFASNCSENVIATTNYGIDLTAAVQNRNVLGCQFHPEKSGTVGLNILKAFNELE